MKQIYNHQIVGDIELRADTRCKGIKYSISAVGNRISFNPRLIDMVLPISDETISWFLNNRHKFEQRATKKFKYTPQTEIKTLTFKVVFVPELRLKTSLSARLHNATLTIRYAPTFDFDNEERQLAIKRVIKHFVMVEAKNILPKKATALAQKYNFIFSSIKINSARTRWGSCGAKKQISLSANLMFLPDEIIDYVIVHELCHTRQMNHGKNFYAEMQKIYPNHKDIDRELKILGRQAIKYLY